MERFSGGNSIRRVGSGRFNSSWRLCNSVITELEPLLNKSVNFFVDMVTLTA